MSPFTVSALRQVSPRLSTLLACAGLLLAPIASCTTRGPHAAHSSEFTGMEVLKNRSRHVDEWVGLAEWAVQVGTNMARAHPVIGHEEPGANLLTWEDIQWATTFDDITQVPSHGGDAQLFRGQDQWLRALYAGIMLVTLLGAVFARRPAVLLATGGLAAGMFVTFLFRSEAMVRRLLGHPREGLEVSWQIGAHMALLGFAGMLLTGGILLRARR